jgi:hypothetical protein
VSSPQTNKTPCFASRKLENKRAEQVLPGQGSGGLGKVAQIMYTHFKCAYVKFKNDKIKFKNANIKYPL